MENNIVGTSNVPLDQELKTKKFLEDFLDERKIPEKVSFKLSEPFIFHPNLGDKDTMAEVTSAGLIIDKPRMSNCYCLNVSLINKNYEPVGNVLFFGDDFQNIVEDINSIHEQGIYRITDFDYFWRNILKTQGVDKDYYQRALNDLNKEKEQIEIIYKEFTNILNKYCS